MAVEQLLHGGEAHVAIRTPFGTDVTSLPASSAWATLPVAP